MWLWVTVLKEIALLPTLYPSFSLTARFFSGRNNDECGFGSILLWSAKRKENVHNPQQLRVRDGPPGSGLLALAEFCHLTPSLTAERRGRVSAEGGGGCMTPHPGNSGRRSGHILFHWGRPGGTGGAVVWATATWHYANAILWMARFEIYEEEEEEGALFFPPRTFSRYCTSGPFWCWSSGSFNQNAWLTCGPLSGVERLRNPRRWVARPSSGCRQMCLEAKSRGLPMSYCTVGCGTVPGCVAHCWVMKYAPGGSCRVCVLIWGRTEINGQALNAKKKKMKLPLFRTWGLN